MSQMRVELDAALFANVQNAMDLHVLAWAAAKDRHRILISDDKDARFLAWLNGLGEQERDAWKLVIEYAYLQESREPAERVVVVLPIAESRWAVSPPQITLSDAASLAQRPFIVLLEDGKSDRSFLRAVASVAERKLLDDMVRDDGLVFESAGGITSLTRRVKGLDAETTTRIWALFDSDALQPSTPSNQSRQAVDACVLAGVPHHRLERRSIENYLTLEALEAWAEASGKARPDRLKKVRALGRLTREQRAHWSMKGGFSGDADREGADAGALFDNVPLRDRERLATGFGDHVWEIFNNYPFPDEDLINDNSINELRSVTAKLTRLLR